MRVTREYQGVYQVRIGRFHPQLGSSPFAWFVCGSSRDNSSTRSSTAEMLPFGESSTHKRLVVDSSAEAPKKASLKLLATWFSDEKTSRTLYFRMVRWLDGNSSRQLFFKFFLFLQGNSLKGSILSSVILLCLFPSLSTPAWTPDRKLDSKEMLCNSKGPAFFCSVG